MGARQKRVTVIHVAKPCQHARVAATANRKLAAQGDHTRIMTLKIHAMLQTILTFLQFANAYTLHFPQAAPFIMAGLTIVQALLALSAHFVNPDGTPAAVAYRPEGSVRP